ncbi:hypothetical protein AB1K18_22410 [Peribacillus simplex]|uniref:hypothetical protein n=1 Tax=Peribacillus simplex TaxID=1478 RepID=UPI003B8B87C8
MILKEDLVYLHVLLFLWSRTLTGLKKSATLLPNNWLAETPQALAPRRLGRQSAERERISEIKLNVFYKKTVDKLAFPRVCLQSGRSEWSNPEP